MVLLDLFLFRSLFRRDAAIPRVDGTLSPFGYNPQIPIEDMDYTKVSVLTIIAAILIVDGFMGYKKRDI